MSKIVITIDAMGGDHGLVATVPASKIALKKHPELTLILVGDEDQLKEKLRKHKLLNHPRIQIQHASEVVTMDELPSQALRGKKDSSMRVAIDLVKSGRASACVSAGNTGALMATARFVLKTLQGIDRPAIVYALPTLDPLTNKSSTVHMLDLGANVDCSAETLFQFAVMGSILTRAVASIEHPRVALLNIGEEEMKGHAVIQDAAKLISESGAVNYTGFVEGNDIFRNKADVIVCDGFIGNVALKTIEGVAKFLAQSIKKSLNRSLFTKICALFALPVLRGAGKTMDMRRYNGASLLGLKGIVIKSHGSAKAIAFATAITEAVKEVEKDVPNEIAKNVEALMSNRS